MGFRFSFTIMAASLAVVTPRVQTINNDPMAMCNGHFTVGGSIKSRDNRWVMEIHNNQRRHNPIRRKSNRTRLPQRRQSVVMESEASQRTLSEAADQLGRSLFSPKKTE
ncbi:hypothetical protein TNCV_4710321 [Trichonephila clavipes]|nr:hypothetical protein TNCV_4710321 [Trichonephila clavipes]